MMVLRSLTQLHQVRAFAATAKRMPAAAAQRLARNGARQPGTVESSVEKRLVELLRPIAPPPQKSPEEKLVFRKKMIRYGKFKRMQHIEMAIRTNRFLLAKWVAIDALPHARRVEALFSESEPLPKNRPIWTDTPPIKEFNSAQVTRSK